MRVVTGKNVEEVQGDALAALADGYPATLVDLGCGDGSFPYRAARSHPRLFCIGIDANAEAMSGYARRAGRKPSRGGVANLAFVAAGMEDLPEELGGRASLITVNFPWSGLLAAVVQGDRVFSDALAFLAGTDCDLQVLINADAEVDGLSPFTLVMIEDALRPALAAAAFKLGLVDWLPEEARVHSQWGGRLMEGSERRVIRLRAQRGAVEPTLSLVLDDAVGLGGPTPG